MSEKEVLFIVLGVLVLIAILVCLGVYAFTTGPFSKKIKKKDLDKYYDFYKLNEYYNQNNPKSRAIPRKNKNKWTK